MKITSINASLRQETRKRKGKRKAPVRPRADFLKPSKSMKRDAIQISLGSVIDIINLSGEDEEINDDSYLE